MRDVTAERIAVMSDLDRMLALSLKAIDDQRLAVTDDIRAERIAAFHDLDAMATRLTERALQQASNRVDKAVDDAIDHLYWRAVQMLAGLILLSSIAALVFFRLFRRRFTTTRT